MVDGMARLLRAMVAAPPEFGVERVQHFGVQVADPNPTNERADVLVDIDPIAGDGAMPAVVLIKVATSSWSIVALVRGFRRWSISVRNRRRTASAVAHAFDRPGRPRRGHGASC
jgi:hypothetical protein